MGKTWHVPPDNKVGGRRKGRHSKKDRAKNKSDRMMEW